MHKKKWIRKEWANSFLRYKCLFCIDTRMERRQTLWRTRLMGTAQDIERKRQLYSAHVCGRIDVNPPDIINTIKKDLPRTFPKEPWVVEHLPEIEKLLISYAAVHKGDSYLQGFNYHMTILFRVFYDTEFAMADTWWCFCKIMGLIRPMIPDFNTSWFHWCRQHWIEELFKRLRRTRPQLHSMFEDEKEHFSTLVTCKWFMLWFAQNVPWSDLFKLWDFLIQLSPEHLLNAYTLLTHEILKEAAAAITYRWSQEPVGALNSLLTLRIHGIEKLAQRVLG